MQWPYLDRQDGDSLVSCIFPREVSDRLYTWPPKCGSTNTSLPPFRSTTKTPNIRTTSQPHCTSLRTTAKLLYGTLFRPTADPSQSLPTRRLRTLKVEVPRAAAAASVLWRGNKGDHGNHHARATLRTTEKSKKYFLAQCLTPLALWPHRAKKNLTVPFYQVLPDLRKSIAFWKDPRLRPSLSTNSNM